MVIMALIMTSKKTMPIKLWQGKQWRHDLLISIQHSLPIPRGAPTLNHIGAQQLSLENWVLGMTIIHYPLAMIIILIVLVLLLLRWYPHPLWVTCLSAPKGRGGQSQGADIYHYWWCRWWYGNDLPSGQVAFINLHWGSVRSSKAEEKSFNLYNILIISTITILIILTIHMIIISFKLVIRHKMSSAHQSSPQR